MAAADSSGFDSGHASRYYVQRRAKGQKKSEKPAQKTTYRRFAKLEAIFDCDSHLILAVAGGLGPRPDSDRLVPLLEEALIHVSIRDIYCDAGYDSEPNHRHARQKRGVRSILPAETGRPSKTPPTGYYRRMMKRRLKTKRSRRRWGYGQRWQAETHLAELKTTLKMRKLKSKTVAGIRKELAIYCLVYNLVHQVMVQAARQQQTTPNRISFLDAVRWLLSAEVGEDLPELVVNPKRPDRHEPRVIKDLQDTYRKMTRSRKYLRKHPNCRLVTRKTSKLK